MEFGKNKKSNFGGRAIITHHKNKFGGFLIFSKTLLYQTKTKKF
jgi:hypothetical protein